MWLWFWAPMPGEGQRQRWLILTSSTGSGHDVRSYALLEWIRREAPESVEAQVWHILEESSWFGWFGVQIYNWIQRHAPWMHQIFWQFAELWGFLIGYGMPWGGRKIRRRLLALRPDLIISMHDALNGPYFALARKVLGPGELRCATYCGEWSAGFGFSRHWVDPSVDFFIARSESVREEAVRRGVPRERTRVFRNLLRPDDVMLPVTEEECRRHRLELGLRPDTFTVMLASGALGADRHSRMLEALEPLGERVQVIVLCGKSKKAYERVSRWSRNHPALRLSIRAFEPQVRRLFTSADCVVTRGGSNMLAECVNYRRPVLFHAERGMMPQEYCTRRFIERAGIGYYLRRPQDLHRAVAGWIEAPSRFDATVSRFDLLPQARSPQELIQMCRELQPRSQLPAGHE